MSKEKKQNYLAFILVTTISAVFLFLGNYAYVKKQPGGIDFLYRWYPTRLVVFEGYENLYSPEVEYQMELFHHGRAHNADEFPGMFSYPYHTMFAFLPVAFIKDFSVARAVWMTIMELAHIGIILLTLRIIHYKPSKEIMIVLILLSLFSADFMQPLIDGNPSSLAALFAVLSLFFISRKSDRWAGVFLAFSTIKPQLVLLFFALVWIWAFSKKRWEIIYSSFATLFILFGISFILLPNWVSEFINDITAYPGAASPSTPRAILSYWMPAPLANNIAWLSTILSVFILGYAWRKSFGQNFNTFLWATSVTFAIMPFTGITSAKSNYIGMLPGIILLLQYGTKKLKDKELWLSILLVVWITLSWLFFYAGRTWMIGDNLIYFIDFYPMPLLLLIIYMSYSPILCKETTRSAINPKTAV